jgi:lipid II:glycine glycyltransferase (peptidoglycan interpeptide bridge formation enzyme)
MIDLICTFLSGRINDRKGIFPTDLILWEAIKWGKNKKLQFLNLGGGMNHQNDTLFNYKKGFSNIVKKNYIGSKIFNLEKYIEFSSINKCEPNKDYFFPIYRKDINSIV